MAAILEYLTSNSLQVYPFKDSASLIAVDLYRIPMDFFLDAQIVPKNKDVRRVYLSQLEKDALNIIFTIELTDIDGITIDTATYTVTAASIVEREVLNFSDSYAYFRVVPGASLAAISASPIFTHTFTIDATEFTPSVVIPYNTTVDSIAFYNTDPSTNLPILEATVTADDLEIVAGANQDFQYLNESLSIAVLAGSGTGLYDGCPAPGSTINSINFVNPNSSGSFFIGADTCYKIEAATNGLLLTNECVPKCTGDQIAAFAHYENRVKDGLLDVGGLANDVRDTIVDEMDTYAATVALTKVQPSFTLSKVREDDSSTGEKLFSFFIKIINPTAAPITVNVDATLTSASLRSDTLKALTDDVVTDYSAFPIDVDIGCQKGALVQCILAVTPPTTGSVTFTLDVYPTTQIVSLVTSP